MAEVVYKKVTELDVYPGTVDGSETLPFVKSGKTWRRALSGFFGSGWMSELLGAFVDFVAPNALHATDSDTVEGQDAATLHSAPLLSGTIHIDRIPADLAGKNAATATLAATATNALACSGNAATATYAASAGSAGSAATATYAASAGSAGSAATAGTAANATAVAAINPVTGKAGTFTRREIVYGTPWVIPAGTYMMIGYRLVPLEDTYTVIEIYSGSAWENGNISPAGLIISDGVNFRIRNLYEGSAPVYYRKLA